MKAVFFISLIFIIIEGGFLLPNLKYMGPNHMARKIILLPIGQVEGWVLDDLEEE